MSRDYSSHLPVLKLIYSIKPFKNILEFGCGSFSTKYLVEVGDSIISIENMSEVWFNKINNEIKSPKFKLLYLPILESITWIKNNNNNYDLIFIDGGEREQCLHACYGKSSLIVVHDWGMRAWRRGWLKNLLKDNRYDFFVCTIANPATAIFTSDKDLVEILKNHKDFIRIDW